MKTLSVRLAALMVAAAGYATAQSSLSPGAASGNDGKPTMRQGGSGERGGMREGGASSERSGMRDSAQENGAGREKGSMRTGSTERGNARVEVGSSRTGVNVRSRTTFREESAAPSVALQRRRSVSVYQDDEPETRTIIKKKTGKRVAVRYGKTRYVQKGRPARVVIRSGVRRSVEDEPNVTLRSGRTVVRTSSSPSYSIRNRTTTTRERGMDGRSMAREQRSSQPETTGAVSRDRKGGAEMKNGGASSSETMSGSSGAPRTQQGGRAGAAGQ